VVVTDTHITCEYILNIYHVCILSYLQRVQEPWRFQVHTLHIYTTYILYIYIYYVFTFTRRRSRVQPLFVHIYNICISYTYTFHVCFQKLPGPWCSLVHTGHSYINDTFLIYVLYIYVFKIFSRLQGLDTLLYTRYICTYTLKIYISYIYICKGCQTNGTLWHIHYIYMYVSYIYHIIYMSYIYHM